MDRGVDWARRIGPALVVAAGSLIIAAAALAFPSPFMPWLSIKGTGGDTEAGEYYSTIGAPDWFVDWKSLYGFGGSETRAVYYNAGDLGFGRDMHCRRGSNGNGAFIACYVVNHGLGPASPPALAVNAAIAGQDALPTVAMVYRAALDGAANDVAFAIYSPTGARRNSVQLDSEGEKYAPDMCLACHGGSYDALGNSVSGANFLPYDAASFEYSGQAGYTLPDQQEELRQLNEMVFDTNPGPAIKDLIQGWYAASGGFRTPGATFNAAYRPATYASGPEQALYDTVVGPYCRSCHIAQAAQFDLGEPLEVAFARNGVFDLFYMPHAELTAHNFWTSTAPNKLAAHFAWSIRVTTTADEYGTGAGCSLREAIRAANTDLAFGGCPAGTLGNNDIITFDQDGTYTLTRAGQLEDAAATGDLDITGNLILLGNGAGQTVISGGSLDRIFHIVGAPNYPEVVIQGVTIRDGAVDTTYALGAGILNEGAHLTLNNSVVRNNSLSAPFGRGAGIANTNYLAVNRSTIGPNNETTGASAGGGGIYNKDAVVYLANSTVTANSAGWGAGVLSEGASIVTIDQTTIAFNMAATPETNTAGTGGGLYNIDGSTATVGNSLITGNTSEDSFADCYLANNAVYTSGGANVFGRDGSAQGCGASGADRVVQGDPATVLQQALAAAANGVLFHPLLAGGPAIDVAAVGTACWLPSFDQRLIARPLGGACDSGATEWVPVLYLPALGR